MKMIEKWRLIKKVRLDFENGIKDLHCKLVDLKNNKKIDKFDNRQRQIYQLLKGLEIKESAIRFVKTPDIFSTFSGRGEIHVTDSMYTKNEIEIEFKSKYKEMWFVFGLFVFLLMISTPFILLGLLEIFWILITIGFFAIVATFKIFLLKNDIKKLEGEFKNLLGLINNNH
jgi:hypothetical protein